jgi:DNA-directed RNA polymerase specialized sigma24 family protein
VNKKTEHCGVGRQQGHPWKELENTLQAIRELVVAGEERRSCRLSDLLREAHPHVVAAASRILRSPRFRYADRDPDEITQRWWVIMVMVGFKKYDPARGPLFPYSYKILARVCQQDNRRGRVRRTYEIPPSYASRAKRSDALAGKREWNMRLYLAVRRLPKNPRRAFILKYWFDKSSVEGARRCRVCVATFNTWTHQARTLLRRGLDPDDWLDAA